MLFDAIPGEPFCQAELILVGVKSSFLFQLEHRDSRE